VPRITCNVLPVRIVKARPQNCEERQLVVCPPTRMEQLGCHWTAFHGIWYLIIFRKSVEEIQVPLKTNKNSAYLTLRPMHIFDNISPNSSKKEKCFRRTL
jgi:hypothetical protein